MPSLYRMRLRNANAAASPNISPRLPRALQIRAEMNRARVDRLLNPEKRVLVAGELILDEFIWGKVSRISPEAPVPVVEVVEETYNAGGAANVARNLREFIDHVHMLGLAGA